MKQNLIIKSLKELNIWDLFYATDGVRKVTIHNTTELKIKQPIKKVHVSDISCTITKFTDRLTSLPDFLTILLQTVFLTGM